MSPILLVALLAPGQVEDQAVNAPFTVLAIRGVQGEVVAPDVVQSGSTPHVDPPDP